MGHFKRNSILNLIFNYSNIIFNLITGIFLVPFYLSKIPLDAYGSFLVATGIAGLIGLLEFGLSMVTTQRLAKSHAETDWPSFRQTTHSGLVAASLLFLATCLATAVTATQIPQLTKISTPFEQDIRIAFLLLGLGAGASIFLNLFGSIFQALLKAGTLGAVNLFSASIGIATIVVLFSSHPSLTAIAVGTFVRATCATLLLMVNAFFSLRRASLLPRPAPLGEAIRLLQSCGPIFIGGVSKSLAENAQNLLLVNATSPTSIAVLALTQKALQVCSMILAPIGSSIYSNLVQIKAKSSPEYFSSLLGISIRSHFLLSVLLTATACTFNELFMSLWVGRDKFGGFGLSLLLGLSTLLTTRFSFFSFLIYSTGDFKKPLTLETSYSLTKIAILFFTIDELGLYAAPIADITAGFVFLFCLSTRLMAPHVSLSRFGKGIYYRGWLEFTAITAAGYYFSSWVHPYLSWLALGSSLGFFLIVMAPCAIAFNASFAKEATGFYKHKQMARG